MLGADWLIYQDLEDLIWAVQDGNEKIKHFDTSCFSGEYVTGLDQRIWSRSRCCARTMPRPHAAARDASHHCSLLRGAFAMPSKGHCDDLHAAAKRCLDAPIPSKNCA
jgi:hypothetical protein